MPITPRQAFYLAPTDCLTCQGAGIVPGTVHNVCDCVCRVIFHTCYAKFRDCQERAASTQTMTLELHYDGRDSRYAWARRHEDYCADFINAAKRVLPDVHFKIFRWQFLLGVSPKQIAPRVELTRRMVEIILHDSEPQVGREIDRMHPHSLYPPRDYLHVGEAPFAV
jgi:hypothetical protein